MSSAGAAADMSYAAGYGGEGGNATGAIATQPGNGGASGSIVSGLIGGMLAIG